MLLAGVAIVALSGCSDKVGEPESVDINNLNRGYLVTGVDGVIEPVAADALNIDPEPGENEIATIQFCPDNNASILWRNGPPATDEDYTIDGADILFSPSGAAIETAEDGTSGKLEVGNTYTIVNKDSEWTIADIQITTEGCPEED